MDKLIEQWKTHNSDVLLERWNKAHDEEKQLIEKLQENGKLSNREMRKLKSIRMKKKYRFSKFDYIGPLMVIFKPKYIKAISSLAREECYSLYDITAYMYLQKYSHYCEGYRGMLPNSLHELCKYVSGSVPMGNPEADCKNHYEAFKRSVKRALERFFDHVFNQKRSMHRFRKNGVVVFSVSEYGFIEYLTSDATYEDLNNFVAKRYELVSDEFCKVGYRGLLMMTIIRNIGMTKHDLTLLWRQYFGGRGLTDKQLAEVEN